MTDDPYDAHNRELLDTIDKLQVRIDRLEEAVANSKGAHGRNIIDQAHKAIPPSLVPHGGLVWRVGELVAKVERLTKDSGDV